MNEFHVGRGANRGPLTVFPIWAEQIHPVSYTIDATQARVGERPGGPTVGSLSVANTAGLPLLLLEGQLLEGGMQHRMIARSILLAPGAEAPLDVVCVEQGRWSGAAEHATRGRRASARVRAGLRSESQQGEVWARVKAYASELGANATSSYVEHAERAAPRLRELTKGFRALPGQMGVLIGVAGQPLTAEIFDSPRMLAKQFDEIVRAAAMDALGQPPVATPARRAIRFINRAALVEPTPAGRAGLGLSIAGRSEYAEVTAIRWHDHELHTLLTNPRHELVLAA